MSQADVVAAMADYYVQRAAYYERVYHKPERQTDLRAMEAWLPDVFEGRRVLEIACGTGWWTPHGAARAASWLATDLNPETMAVAQRKPLPACVSFEAVDAYTMAELGTRTFDAAFTGCWWSHVPLARLPACVEFATVNAYSFAELGGRRFDAAFAGCWWSHVPLQRLPGWLALLHERLEPGARVLMLDNRYVEGSSTPLSRRDADGNTYQQRPLDDGSSHEVLKNFPTPDQAFSMLGPRAADPQWTAHAHYWVLSYTLN